MTVTDRDERRCGARDHLTRCSVQANETTDPDADRMQMLYAEHAAAISRYALRLTGDRARAEGVMQETLLRAWQHPDATDDDERAPRAWLFTVARNMIIDERRSARFRNESGSADLERTYDRASPPTSTSPKAQ